MIQKVLLLASQGNPAAFQRNLSSALGIHPEVP